MRTRKPEIPPEADMDGSEEGDKGRDDRIDKRGTGMFCCLFGVEEDSYYIVGVQLEKQRCFYLFT